MKVLKVILVVLLLLVLAAGAAFGAYMYVNRDQGPEPDDVADSVIALCDEVALKAFDAGNQGIIAYLKQKEIDEEEERKKEEEARKKEEEGDEDDPENYDSTEDTGKNATTEAMIQRYIGTWEQQGILQGGGDLDTTTGSYCTYIFNSDFSYTAKGKDVNGKKINEDGTWKLNANKQIVAGSYTMGIDDSGYLLKDTGERDGKGRKMKYAFAKTE